MFARQPTAEMEAQVAAYRPLEQLIPAHWSEGEIVANDIRQHYWRTGGAGPTLLLLHGFQESALMWLRVAKALESDYDLVMVDARGHGRSVGIATGFSSDLLLEDAAAFIRALGLGPARILGFSQGGNTALRLAANYRELVHSFIYEGWFAEGRIEGLSNSPGYQAWFATWLAWLERLRTLPHAERMVAALSQFAAGGSVPDEENYVPGVDAVARFDLDLARSSMQLWDDSGPDPEALLAQVTCPALIMQHGRAFPAPGATPAIRDVPAPRPNVHVVYFENTGHLIHRAAFAPYMALVRDFLKATG